MKENSRHLTRARRGCCGDPQNRFITAATENRSSIQISQLGTEYSGGGGDQKDLHMNLVMSDQILPPHGAWVALYISLAQRASLSMYSGILPHGNWYPRVYRRGTLGAAGTETPERERRRPAP